MTLQIQTHKSFIFSQDLSFNRSRKSKRSSVDKYKGVSILNKDMKTSNSMLPKTVNNAASVIITSVSSSATLLTDASSPTLVNNKQAGSAQRGEGIGVISFLTAVSSASAVFVIQLTIFVILRNKLARILSVYTPYRAWIPPLTLSPASQRHTWYPSGSEATLRQHHFGV